MFLNVCAVLEPLIYVLYMHVIISTSESQMQHPECHTSHAATHKSKSESDKRSGSFKKCVDNNLNT
jgi:hypothetical protein